MLISFSKMIKAKSMYFGAKKSLDLLLEAYL